MSFKEMIEQSTKQTNDLIKLINELQISNENKTSMFNIIGYAHNMSCMAFSQAEYFIENKPSPYANTTSPVVLDFPVKTIPNYGNKNNLLQ